MAEEQTVLEATMESVTDYVREHPNSDVNMVADGLGITRALAGQALRHCVLYEMLYAEVRCSRKFYFDAGRRWAHQWITRKWT